MKMKNTIKRIMPVKKSALKDGAIKQFANIYIYYIKQFKDFQTIKYVLGCGQLEKGTLKLLLFDFIFLLIL